MVESLVGFMAREVFLMHGRQRADEVLDGGDGLLGVFAGLHGQRVMVVPL